MEDAQVSAPHKFQCASCRRPSCATLRVLDDVYAPMCDECFRSEFRRARVLERVRESNNG